MWLEKIFISQVVKRFVLYETQTHLYMCVCV